MFFDIQFGQYDDKGSSDDESSTCPEDFDS